MQLRLTVVATGGNSEAVLVPMVNTEELTDETKKAIMDEFNDVFVNAFGTQDTKPSLASGPSYPSFTSEKMFAAFNPRNIAAVFGEFVE